MANGERMDALEAAQRALRKDFDGLKLRTQEICTGMAYLVARLEEANLEPGAAKLLADAEVQYSLLKNLQLTYMRNYPESSYPMPDARGLKN